MPEESPNNHLSDILILIRKLIYNTVCLVSQHIKFFREEMKEEAAALVASFIFILAGSVLSFIAALFGGAFLVVTFNLFTSVWWALLFVTIIYLLLAIIVFAVAKSMIKKVSIKKRKFSNEVEKTLEESKKWLEQLNS